MRKSHYGWGCGHYGVQSIRAKGQRINYRNYFFPQKPNQGKRLENPLSKLFFSQKNPIRAKGQGIHYQNYFPKKTQLGQMARDSLFSFFSEKPFIRAKGQKIHYYFFFQTPNYCKRLESPLLNLFPNTQLVQKASKSTTKTHNWGKMLENPLFNFFFPKTPIGAKDQRIHYIKLFQRHQLGKKRLKNPLFKNFPKHQIRAKGQRNHYLKFPKKSNQGKRLENPLLKFFPKKPNQGKRLENPLFKNFQKNQ